MSEFEGLTKEQIKAKAKELFDKAIRLSGDDYVAVLELIQSQMSLGWLLKLLDDDIKDKDKYKLSGQMQWQAEKAAGMLVQHYNIQAIKLENKLKSSGHLDNEVVVKFELPAPSSDYKIEGEDDA